MDRYLQELAESVKGFMPPAEGLALYEYATQVEIDGPYLEIGSYCAQVERNQIGESNQGA